MSECPLTEPQLEVVRWLSQGKTYSEIAEIEGCSLSALQHRTARAWDKTGTSNTTGLVAMALRRGWIE